MSKATYSDGTIVDYSYDANGNRTGTVVTPGTPIPPDTTPPTAPGSPTFSNVAGTTATASWTAATDNVAISGYDYRLNAGAWQSISNVLTFNLTNLVSAQSYTFAVRARDAAGNLSSSTSGTFTTSDTVKFTAPSNVSATSSASTTVNVSWTASTDNVAVTGYRVLRNGGQVGTTTTATSYADNTVSGSVAYSYTVIARDAANNESAPSAAANVTTPDTIAPTVPTSLSATAASPSRINLSWGGSSDSGGSGLAGYRVYRGGSQIATTTATSYSDTALASGTPYSYTVAAYDNASPTNMSAQSNTANATTWSGVTASVSLTLWRFKLNGSNVVIDPAVVCTPSGGSGTGYTYSWQYVSGDTLTSVNGATLSSVTWSRSMPNNGLWESLWRCIVTDNSGNIGQSPTVLVRFTKQGFQ